MDVTRSVNGVTIRLSAGSWSHVVHGHPELQAMRAEVLRAVESPDRVVEGDLDELLAAKELESNKWLVVVYKEVDASDGFIITAYIAKTSEGIDRRLQVWP